MNMMMKSFALIAVALLASSAHAFTSSSTGVRKPVAFASSRSSSSSVLSMAMERTYIMVRRRLLLNVVMPVRLTHLPLSI
jgi:hypothetical protein